MNSFIEHTIATTTHGRYLVVPPSDAPATGTLVGFHGYAEGAEAQLERMRRLPGADSWRLVAIQGMHRFYQRRTNEVIASWMTRQHRELAMADNVTYVKGVLDAVTRDDGAVGRLVVAGFSQGVAMAFRAACTNAMDWAIDGIIAVGGDVPPELDAGSLARIRRALICRGVRDEWYTKEKFEDDVVRLRAANVDVRPVEFDGGHEWSTPVVDAAAMFLADRPEPER